MTRFVLLGMLCLSLEVFAQATFPSEIFHRGQVTLNDGTVYTGMVQYNLESDVILFKEPGAKGIATFTANQFKIVRINQQGIEQTRIFYSLPIRENSGYKRPKIFEALYQGETSLVGREYIIERAQPISQGFARRSLFDPFYFPSERRLTRKYLAYNLYLVDQVGGITLLGKSRGDVIRAFEGHQSELRKFIKQEKLRMNRIEDLTLLVQYYNSLDS